MKIFTKKNLFIILAILAGLNILFLDVINKLDWIGILTNIFSELIGIIITVYLVETILLDHEEKKWANVKIEIDRKLNLFAMKTLSDLFAALNLSDKARFDIEKSVSKGIASYKLNLSIEPELLESNIYDAVYITSLKKNLPNGEHGELIKQAINDGYKIMNFFKEQFSPDLYAQLIRTLEELEKLDNFMKYNLQNDIDMFNRTNDDHVLTGIIYAFITPIKSLIELFNISIFYTYDTNTGY